MEAPLEFEKREDLELWLQDKPIKWSQVIALRSALRVWPLILSIEEFGGRSIDFREIKYSVIQLGRVYLYAVAFIRDGEEFLESPAQRRLLHSASSEIINNMPPARAIGSAALIAVYPDRAAGYAAKAAEVACDSLSRFSRELSSACWKAISADASWLHRSGNNDLLVRCPLWFESAPDNSFGDSNGREWAAEVLSGPKARRLSESSEWKLWLDWYRAILPIDSKQSPRSQFGAVADRAIVSQSLEFWDRDPDEVMTDIAAIVERPRPASEPEIGAQEGGFVFTADNGKLAHVPSLPASKEADDPTQERLFARLKRRVDRFQESMENSLARYPALAEIIDDYAEALVVSDLSDLDIDELWLSGVGLVSQARAFGALDEIRQVTEPLEPEQQALLGEIARLHGAFVMGFRMGRELAERAQIPLFTPETARALLENERAIVRGLLGSTELALSESVRSLFETLDHVLAETSEKIETRAVAGYPILRNLLIFTAEKLSLAVGFASAGSTLLGIPIGSAVQGLGLFLLNNLGDILGFAGSVPELRAYLEFHLTRLEIDYRARHGEDDA